jgi:hypothetical protein
MGYSVQCVQRIYIGSEDTGLAPQIHLTGVGCSYFGPNVVISGHKERVFWLDGNPVNSAAILGGWVVKFVVSLAFKFGH